MYVVTLKEEETLVATDKQGRTCDASLMNWPSLDKRIQCCDILQAEKMFLCHVRDLKVEIQR